MDNIAQTAFDTLKSKFLTAEIMRHFDPKRHIVLETDASDFAIGAVLSQPHDDGLRPVGFYSRKLQAAELNYDTHDKELLATIEALRAWRHYTIGTARLVQIITDHKNLQYFCTSKPLNRQQVCWSEFLSDFNFTLEHQPGKLNAVPDILSCRTQDELDIGDKESMNTCLLNPLLFLAISKYEDPQLPHKQLDDNIRNANSEDAYFQEVVKCLHQPEDDRSKYPEGSDNL